MAGEHGCYPIPPEDLRCSYRYEAFVRCRNWRIQDQSFCQVHFLEYRDGGTMMVEKEKGTKSSVRVSKDEIEMTASIVAAAPRGKGRGRKEKGKTGSRRKRGRNEDDEEVIPERKVRQKPEETEEMKIEEEEEVDLEDFIAEEAPKRRGRKPSKEEIKVKEEEDDLEG